MLRAATSGRPLIEVIDEGQVDLSSDGIKSFEDSSSSSSLTPIFSDPSPTLLMLWMRATVPPSPPPQDTSSPPSLPPPTGQLGPAMRGVAFALKPKARAGLLVFVSPRFLRLRLASTFCRKLLLANQKGMVYAVVLPLRSLICRSTPGTSPPHLPNSRIQFFNTQC